MLWACHTHTYCGLNRTLYVSLRNDFIMKPQYAGVLVKSMIVVWPWKWRWDKLSNSKTTQMLALKRSVRNTIECIKLYFDDQRRGKQNIISLLPQEMTCYKPTCRLSISAFRYDKFRRIWTDESRKSVRTDDSKNWWYNHNKTKNSTPVSIYLGIYLTELSKILLESRMIVPCLTKTPN